MQWVSRFKRKPKEGNRTNGYRNGNEKRKPVENFPSFTLERFGKMKKESTKIRHRPKGNKRTKEQQEYDVAFCSNLFLRGYTYREIADRLNADLTARSAGYTVTFQQVFYDLKQCLIEWKRERMDNIDDYITQELHKLDKIEVELWAEWEKSKECRKRTKNRQSSRPKKITTEHEIATDYYGYNETTSETSVGNPKFLALLLKVQQRRAKMLGFDSPVKIDVSGFNSGADDDKPKYDVKAIPPDLLFAMADKLQSAEFTRVMEEK